MEKNILLRNIIIICIIILVISSVVNIFKTNEHYVSSDNVLHSKFYKPKNSYQHILDYTSNIINYLPRVNHTIDLNKYQTYNSLKENVVNMLQSKQKEIIVNKEPTIFETYYQKVKDGMVNIFVTKNNERIIENVDNAPPNKSDNTQPNWAQDEDLWTQITHINVLFWIFSFVISIGIIYVIVQNGRSAFQELGIYNINKVVKLDKTDNELLDNISSDNIYGGKYYYIGGYDTNLYSD
jgi:hypothetical protein